MRHRVDITFRGGHVDIQVDGRRVRPQAEYDINERRRAWDALMKAEDRLSDIPLEEMAKWLALRGRIDEAWERYHERFS